MCRARRMARGVPPLSVHFFRRFWRFPRFLDLPPTAAGGGPQNRGKNFGHRSEAGEEVRTPCRLRTEPGEGVRTRVDRVQIRGTTIGHGGERVQNRGKKHASSRPLRLPPKFAEGVHELSAFPRFQCTSSAAFSASPGFLIFPRRQLGEDHRTGGRTLGTGQKRGKKCARPVDCVRNRGTKRAPPSTAYRTGGRSAHLASTAHGTRGTSAHPRRPRTEPAEEPAPRPARPSPTAPPATVRPRRRHRDAAPAAIPRRAPR